MKKISDFLFGKNYPLWLILILAVLIGYLAFKPLFIVTGALQEKHIVIINGRAVTCLPFEVKPITEEYNVQIP